MKTTTKKPLEDRDYAYQLVRVMSRDTGKPTTVSLDYILFIKLCQVVRDPKKALAVVRTLVDELEYDPARSLSSQAADAVEAHIRLARAAA